MRSLTEKYWKTSQYQKPSTEELSLAHQLHIAPEIVQLLRQRGAEDADAIQALLFPRLKALPDPFLFSEMEEACRLIGSFLERDRKIMIWGDYDVDGVTSTALLIRFFRMIGARCSYYIPNRFSEGYGLNQTSLKRIIKEKEDDELLLITVDCGIASCRETADLRQNGISVIITDHHEPGLELPKANAIINGKREGERFPDRNMAGVGHAFYLACAVRSHLTEQGYFTKKTRQPPNMKQFLDLVSMGTVADMVPLKEVNRVLVCGGFEVLRKAPSCGLKALMEESDITDGEICSEDISFQLGPKLNAAGRIADAGLAVELLLADDEGEACRIARKLTLLNDKRKELCATYLEQALDMIDVEKCREEGIIIHTLDCSVGILGIIASQIANSVNIPVILLAEVDDQHLGKVLKGSCRSIDNIDIFALLQKADTLLVQYGGHTMAAGLTITENNLELFRKQAILALQSEKAAPAEANSVDFTLSMERAFSSEFIRSYRLLEPYGVDNPTPIFLEPQATIQEVTQIGKLGDHLRFTKRGRYTNQRCISFGLGHLRDRLFTQPHWNLVYTLSQNRFHNRRSWQARVIDIF